MSAHGGMTVAEWAASPGGHLVLLAAARHAIARGGWRQGGLLAELAGLAPVMGAATARSIARFMREEAAAAEEGGCDDGDLMGELALYSACAERIAELDGRAVRHDLP